MSYSDFAYQGFGLVCLKIKCKHFGGDGICIAVMLGEDCPLELLDELEDDWDCEEEVYGESQDQKDKAEQRQDQDRL